MRRLMIVLSVLCWCPLAHAKELRLPKGAINVNQLHEELLAAFPQWGAVIDQAGERRDPGLLRVESMPTEILLTVPDDADEDSVRAVVTAHVPHPRTEPTAPGSLEERVRRLETLLGL